MKRFGKKDLILIAVLFAVCAAVFVLFLLGREAGGAVVVTVDGREFGRYPLSGGQSIEITDANGQVTNVLLIQDGEAHMQKADCPDKLCMHQRAISRAGETIVCLPNRVVAAVEQGDESSLDGFAQ